MNVGSTSASGQNLGAAAQQTLNAAGKLTENFDTFLRLLTTQLQNQDPLKPLDANEFTTQLVQFSSVEQAIAQTTRLDSLLNLQEQNQVLGTAGLIGKTVEANGDTAPLSGGQATITYTLPTAAKSVKIEVQNSLGKTVRTLDGPVSAGDHAVVWDGLDDQGVAQPDGQYTFKVTATDDGGQTYPATTTITGVVSAASAENGQVTLTVDGVKVPLSDVLSVTQTGGQTPA